MLVENFGGKIIKLLLLHKQYLFFGFQQS